ncbi:hypothetical protein FDP41_004228 [Naegleria fowleri]|uniref:protein disulfide-isomerase n=1 Tax=Naegleria fowleri TaxID=5763 RepID=A0A6A5BGE4_NAEFO|nr:uncharacterized protein FDP41_004228 [Naegleria fowleri]KAF0976933.1 hypothetical protein FDP41_004228 [Naegleria fowleri]CAG4709421.1 unnamed protein product [Naegleria fowleri]
MRKLFITLLSVLAALVFAASVVVLADTPEASMEGIIDLSSSNVDSVLDGSKSVLVEFYAPWCGHCKNLAPEMAKLGQAMIKAKPAVVSVAKVNCDVERDICSKYGVQGYPTLKFFPRGIKEPTDYNSGRSVEALVDFINSKEPSARLRVSKEPTFAEELTPSNFDSIVFNPEKNVLVKFYAPWCGHCKKMAPDYEKVAKAFANERNVVVAKVDSDKYRDLASKYGVQGYPTLKFFPAKADKQAEEYNAGRDAQAMVDFLNQKASTFRTVEGTLSDSAGLVYNLASFVKSFVSASTNEERKEIMKQAEEKLKTLNSSVHANGDLYIKAMARVIEKGMEYIDAEIVRVEKILGAGSVSGERADAMKTRLNILKTFQK